VLDYAVHETDGRLSPPPISPYGTYSGKPEDFQLSLALLDATPDRNDVPQRLADPVREGRRRPRADAGAILKSPHAVAMRWLTSARAACGGR